jgi:hypothetical protein
MNEKNQTKREDIERLIRQAQFENKFKQNKNVEELNNSIAPSSKQQLYYNKNIIKSAIKRDQISAQKKKALEDSFGSNSVKSAVDFLNPNKNWYLNFGGAGDLILLIANAYKDKKAQIVFYANTCSLEFCKELLECFKLEHYVSRNLMGTKYANAINDYMVQKLNFKPSAHLARGLDFNDWGRDIEYYKNRMVLKTDWIETLGKNLNFSNENCVVIQPSGSMRNYDRQRYLEVFEYNYLVRKFLDLGCSVITTGSESDKDFYKWKPTTNKDWFLTSKKIYGQKSVSLIDLTMFLKIVNCANKVISADTWLKSYSLLCGIPTYVFNNRCRGNYLPIGSDPCDYIFLNKNLWQNLEVKTIDELIKMN